MSKHFYPAIFTEEDVGYSVRFPDFDGCFSEGDTLDEAYQMAVDAIGLYLEQQDGKFSFPKSSNPKQIQTENQEFVVLIEFDELEYLESHDGSAAKLTTTIPRWLKRRGDNIKAPYSQILQQGLKEYLHIDQ